MSKNQISAKIIADSTSKGNRITTFELQYPRFVHSELMTHRLFSRNAASSRAIPIKDKIKMVWKNPVIPVSWGRNQSGMQASKQLEGWRLSFAKSFWKFSSKVACVLAFVMMKFQVHKQITNRILEPFEVYKTIVTATEFDNWFHLRNHKDAQPEIRQLSIEMFRAMSVSVPKELAPHQWHLPYIEFKDGEYFSKGQRVTLGEAQKISASCCAQVSYRTLKESIKVAINIYNKLVESSPVHASPFEHQATPMSRPNGKSLVVSKGHPDEGVTHMDMNGNYWSGNLKGWVQHRQLIPGHAVGGYSDDPVAA